MALQDPELTLPAWATESGEGGGSGGGGGVGSLGVGAASPAASPPPTPRSLSPRGSSSPGDRPQYRVIARSLPPCPTHTRPHPQRTPLAHPDRAPDAAGGAGGAGASGPGGVAPPSDASPLPGGIAPAPRPPAPAGAPTVSAFATDAEGNFKLAIGFYLAAVRKVSCLQNTHTHARNHTHAHAR